MCYKAIDIANLIIAKTDADKGDYITNLKLQKLLYYMQGFHLAIYNKPLYAEKIVAWQYGPVVKDIYFYFEKCGNAPIPMPDTHENVLTSEQYELFEWVYKMYSQFSASKLVDMTHSESPWIETEISHIISHEKLKRFFRTRVE